MARNWNVDLVEKVLALVFIAVVSIYTPNDFFLRVQKYCLEFGSFWCHGAKYFLTLKLGELRMNEIIRSYSAELLRKSAPVVELKEPTEK